MAIETTIETCQYCGKTFDATEDDLIVGYFFCSEEHADKYFEMVG